MENLDINAEISERVMGWVVDRGKRQYCDPLTGSGVWEWLPDFRFVKQDYDLFLEKMKSLGYTFTESDHPPDLKKGTGPCCTASFSKQGESFQATYSDQRLAVCVAALAAHQLAIHE